MRDLDPTPQERIERAHGFQHERDHTAAQTEALIAIAELCADIRDQLDQRSPQ